MQILDLNLWTCKRYSMLLIAPFSTAYKFSWYRFSDTEFKIVFGCRDGRKKQNLKCVRFNVNGECRVLLVANRDIRQGERLYYDYNGYENEYPTEHFV